MTKRSGIAGLLLPSPIRKALRLEGGDNQTASCDDDDDASAFITYGSPVDFNAEIPVFPPAAGMFATVFGLALWAVSGARATFLPLRISNIFVRVGISASILAFSSLYVRVCENALIGAGSAVKFTEVKGICTTFPFNVSRNPMYLGLVLFMVPMQAILFDSAWILAWVLPLFLYLHFVVIAAEERKLKEKFGKAYIDYLSKVPRWLVV